MSQGPRQNGQDSRHQNSGIWSHGASLTLPGTSQPVPYGYKIVNICLCTEKQKCLKATSSRPAYGWIWGWVLQVTPAILGTQGRLIYSSCSTGQGPCVLQYSSAGPWTYSTACGPAHAMYYMDLHLCRSCSTAIVPHDLQYNLWPAAPAWPLVQAGPG